MGLADVAKENWREYENRAKEKACKDNVHIIDGTGLKCFCGRIDLPMTIPEAFRKPNAKVML